MGQVDRKEFKQVVESSWSEVYNFSFRMCLDVERASEVVRETYLQAFLGAHSLPEEGQRTQWLLKIVQHVLETRLSRSPEVSFEILDDTLRSEETRTDIVRSLTEPRRDFMLWELKQGCMTSVVNCLSPGERSAFVLTAILGYGETQAAEILEITPSALKVRLSRAKKKVSDYLAPRCEHVDPNNPCRCPARVGTALSKGFIRPAGEVSLHDVSPFGRYGSGPNQEDEPLRDVQAIYANLPVPDAPASLREEIDAAIDGDEWQRALGEAK